MTGADYENGSHRSPKCYNCKSRKDSVSEVMLDRPDGGLTPSWLCDDCKELAGVPGYV